MKIFIWKTLHPVSNGSWTNVRDPVQPRYWPVLLIGKITGNAFQINSLINLTIWKKRPDHIKQTGTFTWTKEIIKIPRIQTNKFKANIHFINVQNPFPVKIWPLAHCGERFLRERRNEFYFRLIKAFQFDWECTREALFRLFRLFEIITSKFKGWAKRKISGPFEWDYDTFMKLAEMVALICDDDLRFL